MPDDLVAQVRAVANQLSAYIAAPVFEAADTIERLQAIEVKARAATRARQDQGPGEQISPRFSFALSDLAKALGEEPPHA